jgi:hypothetical protein
VSVCHAVKVIAKVFGRNPAVCGWSGKRFAILAPLGPDRIRAGNFSHNVARKTL